MSDSGTLCADPDQRRKLRRRALRDRRDGSWRSAVSRALAAARGASWVAACRPAAGSRPSRSHSRRSSPVSGSKAAPPHSPPPSNPGKTMLPSWRLGGSKGRCCAPCAAWSARRRVPPASGGSASYSVRVCRANGAGFSGRGWVSASFSPSTSDWLTGAVLDREERLAGFALEDEDVSRLGDLRNRVDQPCHRAAPSPGRAAPEDRDPRHRA